MKNTSSNIQNSSSSPPMDTITLLTRPGPPHLTPEEESRLTQELSSAYHMDEAASTSRDVQRIAEKVRAILESPDSSQ